MKLAVALCPPSHFFSSFLFTKKHNKQQRVLLNNKIGEFSFCLWMIVWNLVNSIKTDLIHGIHVVYRSICLYSCT